MSATSNPVGLEGIEFVELAAPEPETLHRLFHALGFSRLAEQERGMVLYGQKDIRLLLNRRRGSFSDEFRKIHGPCISSLGLRVRDAALAHRIAVGRGARSAGRGDYFRRNQPVPAVYGIGESLIYFVDGYREADLYRSLGFKPLESPDRVEDKGFEAIDHLTNNVPQGELKRWADFYRDVFGFTEVRYFDIRGVKTGLQSFALRSPCGTFCIPINEGTERESQINEYLREYRGPGIQHLAFLTNDILGTLKKLEGGAIETLDIDDEYYRTVFDRVPNVTEDKSTLQRYKVLVDGDDKGYLLQIFTKNLIGPIFVEIIQRKNHLSFGEGNFGALFRSIEKDQQKRGILPGS